MSTGHQKLAKLLALRQLRLRQAALELSICRQEAAALENRAREMSADRDRLWRDYLAAEAEQVDAVKDEGFGRFDLMDMDMRTALVRQQKSRMQASEEYVWNEHKRTLQKTGVAEQRYKERSRKLDALKTVIARMERKNRIKLTLVAEEAEGGVE